jgi:cytoskeleton protein RodZ
MENTDELEIDIDDIGTILKSSRLKQKKSMEEISAELCIRKIYLTALEESDYETLEPIPYGIGYVRTYARYLGLNPERAVKLYKAAAHVEEKNIEVPEVTPQVNKSANRHLVFAFGALFIFYVLWIILSSYIFSRTAEKNAKQPSKEVSQTMVEEKTQVEIPVEMVPENVEDSTFSPIEEEYVEEPANVESEAPKDAIVLEFSGESWVEIRGKNRVYVQGVYHRGDRKEIAYTDNLFLSVGRPRNVNVFIKGKSKDILAKRRKTNIPLDSLE